MKTRNQRTFSPWAFAAIAAIFVFGFIFTGCGDKDDNGGKKPVAVTSVSIGAGTINLMIGGTETLTATVQPPDANQAVTWSSSDPTKASVDASTGLVTALAVGTTNITATTVGKRANGTSATAIRPVSVSAVQIPAVDVSLEKTSTTLEIDASEQLTALFEPENANAGRAVTWSITPPTGIASVAANGTVTGVGVGTATITVSLNSNPAKKAECTVTVIYKPVTGVTLNKSTLEFGLDGVTTETLTATVAPDKANPAVTWASSDSTKATVDASTGLVTAVAAGTANITATTVGKKADGTSATATCVVTVSATILVESITVAPTLGLALQGTGTLTANVLPANASNKNVNWSTSAPGVATVTGSGTNNATGTVSAVSAGTATITVTAADGSGKSATCTVTVAASGDMPEIEGYVWIKPGSFSMGSPATEKGHFYFEDEDDLEWTDEGEHTVTLTKGFYMGHEAVSQALYEEIMGYNPSMFVPSMDSVLPFWPVDSVTWYDAVEFCNKLSDRDGLTKVYTISNRRPVEGYPITGAEDRDGQWTVNVTQVTANWNANGYRLPTEAEWEYACRAGAAPKTIFNTGNTISTMSLSDEDDYGDANFDGTEPYPNNPAGDYRGQTMPGPLFYEPSAWGLYDMHGNLREWCWDWYAQNYGSNNASQTDPRGGASPTSIAAFTKVIRGGAFWDPAIYVRSAARDIMAPNRILQEFNNAPEGDYGCFWIGFRVVCHGTPTALPAPSFKTVNGKNMTADMLMQLKGTRSIPQGIWQDLQLKPQAIQLLGQKLEASPVSPQALRRKAVLE